MATLKPKMTSSSVRGRIIVTAEDGERIGQWGGTECFLSRQTGLGPCLVVRSSRHKTYEGTFFRLLGVKSVWSTYVAQGKLTVEIPHEQRVCTVFVETTVDIDALKVMAAVLQDRNLWKGIEKNVACKKKLSAMRGGVKGRGLREIDTLDILGWDNKNNADGVNYSADIEENDAAGDNGNGDDVYGGGGKPMRSEEKQYTLSQTKQTSNAATVKSFAASSSRKEYNDNVTRAVGMSFTEEQMHAIQLVRSGRNVFITGSAGTGKTAWLMHLIEHVLSRSEGTVVTATTGIAARLIGGCTIYAFAGIGRGEGTVQKVCERVMGRPETVRAWRRCRTLIIDEIAVLPCAVFLLLDEVARRVRNTPEKPFGGIQLVLLGDFLQLPPVTTGGTSVTAAPKWCFECPLWENLQLAAIEFRKNYRHETDPVFAACMEDIRYGLYTRRVANLLSSCLERRLGERFGVEPTLIVARRQCAAAYNMERLQKLEDVNFFRYASEDYASTPGYNLDKEVSLLPLLELRVGAQVVLLAALPNAPHLSNGDLGVVVAFSEQTHGAALPVVCFANSSGEEVVVPRVQMDVTGADGSVVATRTQIPLQLAWALTAHRVQGMTLPMARVKLDAGFFECGQAYVALTRARRQEDISITDFDPSVIRADAKAVAFYKNLFPRVSQAMQENGSELVEVKTVSKRPRSPTVAANTSCGDADDIPWKKERLFDSQIKSSYRAAPSTDLAAAGALRFLAVAVSDGIPQLTQESDTAGLRASQTWQASQHTLLLDAE